MRSGRGCGGVTSSKPIIAHTVAIATCTTQPEVPGCIAITATNQSPLRHTFASCDCQPTCTRTHPSPA